MHLRKSIKDGMCVDFVQFGLDDYIPFVTINKSERSDFKAIQNKCGQCQYWYFYYSSSEVCYACGLMNKLVFSVFFRASLYWSCTPAGLWSLLFLLFVLKINSIKTLSSKKLWFKPWRFRICLFANAKQVALMTSHQMAFSPTEAPEDSHHDLAIFLFILTISILLLNVKYIILCHSIAHLIEENFFLKCCNYGRGGSGRPPRFQPKIEVGIFFPSWSRFCIEIREPGPPWMKYRLIPTFLANFLEKSG